MIREIIMSFQRVHRGQTTWVGLGNYRQITADPEFWQAWRNTLEFTGLALVFGFAAPFAVAIVVNEFRHAQGYLRILVYLPVMLPPVAGILLFKYFMDPGFGLFNQALHFLHLPTLAVAGVEVLLDALAGGGLDVEQHGHRDAGVPGRPARDSRRPVRGGRTRRLQRLAADPARHHPANPADPVADG